MFSDTPEGADASGILYSLSRTAKLNGKDPHKVLKEVFEKIPSCEAIDDFESLAELFLSSSRVG